MVSGLCWTTAWRSWRWPYLFVPVKESKKERVSSMFYHPWLRKLIKDLMEICGWLCSGQKCGAETAKIIKQMPCSDHFPCAVRKTFLTKSQHVLHNLLSGKLVLPRHYNTSDVPQPPLADSYLYPSRWWAPSHPPLGTCVGVSQLSLLPPVLKEERGPQFGKGPGPGAVLVHPLAQRTARSQLPGG